MVRHDLRHGLEIRFLFARQALRQHTVRHIVALGEDANDLAVLVADRLVDEVNAKRSSSGCPCNTLDLDAMPPLA